MQYWKQYHRITSNYDPTVCYITLIYHVYVPRRTQLWVANRWLWDSGVPGVRLNIKTSSHQHRNFHYRNKLIFIMEIPIPGKTVFILRRDPGSRLLCGSSSMSPLFGTPCCHCTETCMFSCLLHTKWYASFKFWHEIYMRIQISIFSLFCYFQGVISGCANACR